MAHCTFCYQFKRTTAHDLDFPRLRYEYRVFMRRFAYVDDEHTPRAITTYTEYNLKFCPVCGAKLTIKPRRSNISRRHTGRYELYNYDPNEKN